MFLIPSFYGKKSHSLTCLRSWVVILGPWCLQETLTLWRSHYQVSSTSLYKQFLGMEKKFYFEDTSVLPSTLICSSHYEYTMHAVVETHRSPSGSRTFRRNLLPLPPQQHLECLLENRRSPSGFRTVNKDFFHLPPRDLNCIRPSISYQGTSATTKESFVVYSI